MEMEVVFLAVEGHNNGNFTVSGSTSGGVSRQ